MSDNFILDLVNKIFLDYNPQYSSIINEDIVQEKTEDEPKEEISGQENLITDEDSHEEQKEKNTLANKENFIPIFDVGIDELEIQRELLIDLETQRRLLINLPMQANWQNNEIKSDITEEFRPIDSKLESHIFEFGNKFIGADYPSIEQRQLYSALNPSTYSMVHSDFIFGEHHKTNVYTDNKPVYTAMRSEKVNIASDANKPVYMRMRHS